MSGPLELAIFGQSPNTAEYRYNAARGKMLYELKSISRKVS